MTTAEKNILFEQGNYRIRRRRNGDYTLEEYSHQTGSWGPLGYATLADAELALEQTGAVFIPDSLNKQLSRRVTP